MTAKVTLKQISEMAKVSPATASRVINNYPNVSPDVRQRVLQVVEETGYQPNPAARSLARGKSQVLGLIIPQSTRILFSDPYFARLIEGIAEACKEYDYVLSLILFHTIEDESRVVSRILRQQSLDGVIFTATQSSDSAINQLLEAKIPFVLVGQQKNQNVSFVDADNYMGAYMAVTHLASLGYQRIATITGSLDNLAAVQRKQGYLQALQDRGLTIDDALVAQGNFTEISGYTAAQTLLAHQPDAIFAASDTMALGAIRALKKAGLAIPQDVAIVGYDDLSPATMATPPLTTIRQPIRRAGKSAVSTLMDLLSHGISPARRIILPVELIIRQSCGDR